MKPGENDSFPIAADLCTILTHCSLFLLLKRLFILSGTCEFGTETKEKDSSRLPVDIPSCFAKVAHRPLNFSFVYGYCTSVLWSHSKKSTKSFSMAIPPIGQTALVSGPFEAIPGSSFLSFSVLTYYWKFKMKCKITFRVTTGAHAQPVDPARVPTYDSLVVDPQGPRTVLIHKVTFSLHYLPRRHDVCHSLRMKKWVGLLSSGSVNVKRFEFE